MSFIAHGAEDQALAARIWAKRAWGLRLGALSLLATGVTACAPPPPPAIGQTPIPALLAGGLFAYGEVARGRPFPLLVDTATVLTTRTVPSRTEAAFVRSTLRVLDRNQVPRADLPSVRLLEAALGDVGIDSAQAPVGGVLGGDLLQLYTLKLRYDPLVNGTGTGEFSLLPPDLACSCALARDCQALLPFALRGGGNFQLGDNIYTYPPTRVTVDACLQPVQDPGRRGLVCQAPLPLGYTAEGAPGVDVRMLVATGFPGILLGATAYDRLCDAQRRFLGRTCAGGSAAALLATGPHVVVRFANPDATIFRAVRLQLGDPQGTPPLAALALVGREGLLSPCGELARSRRLRASPPPPGACDSTARPTDGCLQVLTTGGNDVCGDPDRCNDLNQPAAAYLELKGPLDIYLVPDTAPILLEVNQDVRPRLSDVEGIVGTELLQFLDMEIDYPNERIIAQCNTSDDRCLTFPRYACPTGSSRVRDCGSERPLLCAPPSSIVPGVACQPMGAGGAGGNTR